MTSGDLTPGQSLWVLIVALGVFLVTLGALVFCLWLWLTYDARAAMLALAVIGVDRVVYSTYIKTKYILKHRGGQ